MEEYLHSFLTLRLDECEWPPSCPGCSTPMEKAPQAFWNLELVWTLWKREKSLDSGRN
jgi:hypothetical protein